MVEGPFGLARKRLGRSIEFRVQNATRVIVDQLRTDLDFRLATMHTEQQVAGLLIDERLRSLASRLDALDRLGEETIDQGDRRQRELQGRIEDLQRQHRATSAENAQEREELSTTLHGLVADLGTSVGRISASITDSHRQQAAFLDRLTARLDALDTRSEVTPDTSDAT